MKQLLYGWGLYNFLFVGPVCLYLNKTIQFFFFLLISRIQKILRYFLFYLLFFIFSIVLIYFFIFSIVLIYKSETSKKKKNCPHKLINVLPKNFAYKQLLFNDNHSPARTFFFIRCPMNKKIILVWPYYLNYDIGIHEIWQPFMKLYKCIYPSTSSPLENVQVKIHISTTVVISVINFQLFGLSGASFLPIPVLVCSLLRAHF